MSSDSVATRKATDEGGPSGSKVARFLKTSRTVIGPTSIGTGIGGVIGYVAMLVGLDPTGWARTITTVGGGATGVLKGILDVSLNYREKRVAIHAAMLAAEAEGIRLRLEAEAGEDRRKLIEAERLVAEWKQKVFECEREKADVLRRLDDLETNYHELNADMRGMRIAFEGERKDMKAERAELMAELRETRASVKEKANEDFRKDAPKGPTP